MNGYAWILVIHSCIKLWPIWRVSKPNIHVCIHEPVLLKLPIHEWIMSSRSITSCQPFLHLVMLLLFFCCKITDFCFSLSHTHVHTLLLSLSLSLTNSNNCMVWYVYSCLIKDKNEPYLTKDLVKKQKIFDLIEQFPVKLPKKNSPQFLMGDFWVT